MKDGAAQKLAWAVLAACAVAGCFWAHLHFSAQRAVRRVIEERKDICARFGIETDGRSPFVALLPMLPHEDAPARLGRDLFREPRLAKARNRMCVSCHPPNEGGTDGKVHGGQLTRPTLNAVFADRFLHDGSATGLASVIVRMIGDPAFCAARSLSNAVERIAHQSAYAQRINTIYGERPSVSNVVYSIAQYHKTMLTPQGPFDRFCAGAKDAIPPAAQAGAKVFERADCASCHDGPTLGGRRFHEGRKVSNLRGLAQRRTYQAGGDVRTDLSAILAFMPGMDGISDEDRAALIAFLRIL